MLTMLGIVIGVAAVVMMQSMGRGATAYVGEAISGLGSNMLIVIPGTARGMQQTSLGVPLFTAGDLDAIRRQAHDVALVSAAGSRITRVVVGPYNRIGDHVRRARRSTSRSGAGAPPRDGSSTRRTSDRPRPSA